MSGEEDRRASEAEVEIEIRQRRKFTPQEAIGRLAGPGTMKGASPVSAEEQAENAVASWLAGHVDDPARALQRVLQRHLKGSKLLLENIDRPLAALAAHCRRLLASDQLLQEFVREVDCEWGRLMDERPFFDKAGAPADPDDPYTLESVRDALAEALKQLPDER
jgi:hypothetical protein